MNNNIPPITKNLLIINVLCFFGAIVAERYGIDADKVLSLHFFMASDFNMGQLVTYMFMHGGFTLQYVCSLDVRTCAGAGLGAKEISNLLYGLRNRCRTYSGTCTIY